MMARSLSLSSGLEEGVTLGSGALLERFGSSGVASIQLTGIPLRYRGFSSRPSQ